MATKKRSAAIRGEDGPSTPKRLKSDEGLTPSELQEPGCSVCVDGLLLNVSPIKNKRFVAEIVDESTSISVVGFEATKQDQLSSLQRAGKAITMSNCDVQYNPYSKKLEVVLRRRSIIEASSREFIVPDADIIGASPMTMSELHGKKEFSKVNVRVKVIEVKGSQNVGKGLKKQNVIVADKTGNGIVVLWEEDIGKLELNSSYYITKANVKIFQGDYYLSVPSSGCAITKIEDIGDVMEEQADPMEPTMKGVSIVAVKQLLKFQVCLSCKAKIPIESECDGIVTCERCSGTQKVGRGNARVMAKMLLEGPYVCMMTLVAYEDILQSITKNNEITAENLLKAPMFDVTYNCFHVMTSVSCGEE